jgi:hypothetical protein
MLGVGAKVEFSVEGAEILLPLATAPYYKGNSLSKHQIFSKKFTQFNKWKNLGKFVEVGPVSPKSKIQNWSCWNNFTFN